MAWHRLRDAVVDMGLCPAACCIFAYGSSNVDRNILPGIKRQLADEYDIADVDELYADMRLCDMPRVKSVQRTAWVEQVLKARCIELYVKMVDGMNVVREDPKMVQIVNRAGRKHRMYLHSWDLLMWYVSCFTGNCVLPGDVCPLSVVEVPLPFLPDAGKTQTRQQIIKLYMDWDADAKLLQFLGEEDNIVKVDAVRTLALGAPAAMCGILTKLGMLDCGEEVQVLVKEGTRKRSDGSWKVSFHFIFQIVMTVGEYQATCQRILMFLKFHIKDLYWHINNPQERVGSVDTMKDFQCLLGWDQHSLVNAHQGLAFAFSRKALDDPPSAFVGILHLTLAPEACPMQLHEWSSRWEIPCSETWTGPVCIEKQLVQRKISVINILDPAKVTEAMWLASICMPTSRCIKLKNVECPSLQPRAKDIQVTVSRHG